MQVMAMWQMPKPAQESVNVAFSNTANGRPHGKKVTFQKVEQFCMRFKVGVFNQKLAGSELANRVVSVPDAKANTSLLTTQTTPILDIW